MQEDEKILRVLLAVICLHTMKQFVQIQWHEELELIRNKSYGNNWNCGSGYREIPENNFITVFLLIHIDKPYMPDVWHWLESFRLNQNYFRPGTQPL